VGVHLLEHTVEAVAVHPGRPWEGVAEARQARQDHRSSAVEGVHLLVPQVVKGAVAPPLPQGYLRGAGAGANLHSLRVEVEEAHHHLGRMQLRILWSIRGAAGARLAAPGLALCKC